MNLHSALKNDDCIGQKVTANIPLGLEWVDYPDDFIGGVITSDGVEPHIPNTDNRDVYVEGGLLGFCQGETCEIKAFDETAGTVTLLNNDPNRSLCTSGDNATEFAIPYEWFAACFDTDWAVSIDGTLKQHISEAKQELLNLIEKHRIQHGVEEAFDKLGKHLGGYNSDGELFDFAFDIRYNGYDVISTITLRDGILCLSDDCEIWLGSSQIDMHYNWEKPSQMPAPEVKKEEKPSVLDAIRADRQKPRQPAVKTDKSKNRSDDDR